MRETREQECEALLERIEDAIKLAAQLGADAFDFIEGRGLYQERLAIQSDVRHLAAPRAPETEHE